MQNKPDIVPYIVFESVSARHERIIRRLTTAVIVAILVIFCSNAIWLWAWMQYDYTSETTETVTVDGANGVAAYANGGSVLNGIGKTVGYTPKDANTERIEGNEEAEVIP